MGYHSELLSRFRQCGPNALTAEEATHLYQRRRALGLTTAEAKELASYLKVRGS